MRGTTEVQKMYSRGTRDGQQKYNRGPKPNREYIITLSRGIDTNFRFCVFQLKSGGYTKKHEISLALRFDDCFYSR